MLERELCTFILKHMHGVRICMAKHLMMVARKRSKYNIFVQNKLLVAELQYYYFTHHIIPQIKVSYRHYAVKFSAFKVAWLCGFFSMKTFPWITAWNDWTPKCWASCGSWKNQYGALYWVNTCKEKMFLLSVRFQE